MVERVLTNIQNPARAKDGSVLVKATQVGRGTIYTDSNGIHVAHPDKWPYADQVNDGRELFYGRDQDWGTVLQTEEE